MTQPTPRRTFRPWNSFLAKKSAVEAAATAAAYAATRQPPAVVRLTAGLIDTYEGINHAYYHARQPAVSRASAGFAPNVPETRDRESGTRRSGTSSNGDMWAPTDTVANASGRVGGVGRASRGSAGSMATGGSSIPLTAAASPGSSAARRSSLLSGTAPLRRASGINFGSNTTGTSVHSNHVPPPAPGSQSESAPASARSSASTSPSFSAGGAGLGNAESSRLSSSGSGFAQAAVRRQGSGLGTVQSSYGAYQHESALSEQAHAGNRVQSNDESAKDASGVEYLKPSESDPASKVSPQAVKYCDANCDYIVRPGDMFHNRYMLEKVIGRGTFGQVVRAYDTRSDSHVAIKIIKNNSLYVEQALSEVRMTAYLNRVDPDDAYSIMRIFDKFIFRGHQCLVLELLSFSLYDLLRSTQFYGVSLNLVRKFTKQILNCLVFLSREDVNIAHCDLKPENVLLRHPQRSAIKVVDFGAARRVSETMLSYVQSRFYRAPEVILGLPYSTQVDVWSLGCMLVELHTGFPLFPGRDEPDQMAVIVERLGTPPDHMLNAGKKTGLFFDRLDAEGRYVPVDAQAVEAEGMTGSDIVAATRTYRGSWVLKPDVAKREEPVKPGSRTIQSFIDEYSIGSSGKRKRVSGGHSESDYEVYLHLACQMLRYDPNERISAIEASRNPFVARLPQGDRKALQSGRDSPTPMPVASSSGVNPMHGVEPKRAAPVHSRTKNVNVTVSGPRVGDVGGSLRLSKSESAIPPVPAPLLIFHSSDWAEEVGIEPPVWRGVVAGSLDCRVRDMCEDEDSLVFASIPTMLRAAGGGRSLPVSRRALPQPTPSVLGTVFGKPVLSRVIPRLTSNSQSLHAVEVNRLAGGHGSALGSVGSVWSLKVS